MVNGSICQCIFSFFLEKKLYIIYEVLSLLVVKSGQGNGFHHFSILLMKKHTYPCQRCTIQNYIYIYKGDIIQVFFSLTSHQLIFIQAR